MKFYNLLVFFTIQYSCTTIEQTLKEHKSVLLGKYPGLQKATTYFKDLSKLFMDAISKISDIDLENNPEFLTNDAKYQELRKKIEDRINDSGENAKLLTDELIKILTDEKLRSKLILMKDVFPSTSILVKKAQDKFISDKSNNKGLDVKDFFKKYIDEGMLNIKFAEDLTKFFETSSVNIDKDLDDEKTLQKAMKIGIMIMGPIVTLQLVYILSKRRGK